MPKITFGPGYGLHLDTSKIQYIINTKDDAVLFFDAHSRNDLTVNGLRIEALKNAMKNSLIPVEFVLIISDMNSPAVLNVGFINIDKVYYWEGVHQGAKGITMRVKFEGREPMLIRVSEENAKAMHGEYADVYKEGLVPLDLLREETREENSGASRTLFRGFKKGRPGERETFTRVWWYKLAEEFGDGDGSIHIPSISKIVKCRDDILFAPIYLPSYKLTIFDEDYIVSFTTPLVNATINTYYDKYVNGECSLEELKERLIKASLGDADLNTCTDI